MGSQSVVGEGGELGTEVDGDVDAGIELVVGEVGVDVGTVCARERANNDGIGSGDDFCAGKTFDVVTAYRVEPDVVVIHIEPPMTMRTAR